MLCYLSFYISITFYPPPLHLILPCNSSICCYLSLLILLYLPPQLPLLSATSLSLVTYHLSKSLSTSLFLLKPTLNLLLPTNPSISCYLPPPYLPPPISCYPPTFYLLLPSNFLAPVTYYLLSPVTH